MGNHASWLVVGNKKETIQVVCSDGSVRLLHKIVSAGQIMQEFPQHLVCHSRSFYIGQKTPALSPDGQLMLGNRYFILPDHFFQSPLSLVSLAALISPPALKVPAFPTAGVSPLLNIARVAVLCQPFEIEKSNVNGDLRIRVSAEFITKLMEDGRLKADEPDHAVVKDSADDDEQCGLCNTAELRKDYAQLVTFSGQSWKPKLQTISEKQRVGRYKRFMKINRTDID
jgi:hypothetical protein